MPLEDQPYMNTIDQVFKTTVTAGGKVYGAPYGAAVGGGVLYNKAVYSRLGLQVPKTWAEFMANNAKIKAASVAIRSIFRAMPRRASMLAPFWKGV